MTFKLTDLLKSEILFAMEDQGKTSCVDAQKGILRVIASDDGIIEEDAGDAEIDIIDIDEENYYSIPSWESSDGFELMENFTAGLHNPNAYRELRNCLANRRGVFRNFKNILKTYPEVEKKWFAYKDKMMYARITEWYNELCESWGLEKLEENPESEDTEFLVQEDFEFTEYDSLRDKECVDREVDFLAEEIEKQNEGPLGSAAAEIFRRQSHWCSNGNKFGYVCYSLEGEFLGCALVSDDLSPAKKTVELTDFFVIQNYRGLGIGKQLFNGCLELLKKRGIQWVILSNTFISEPLESLLFEYSFEKKGFGYVKNFLE